jgi:beta-lactamase superfamily II metal-dependent hydrolase
MTAPHVTVRMYKGLLGDCFLLRLFDSLDGAGRKRKADANILIDCGILQRAPKEKDLIARVARSIRDDCERLDLVVVTHEHYDHLCGFGAAEEIFLAAEGLPIDRLWLAWTEDPDDPDANKLRAARDEIGMAIAGGVRHMAMRAQARSAGDAQAAAAEWYLQGAAMGLDGFMGPFAAGASGAMTSREILARLKSKAGETEYLEPGEVRKLPFAESVTAFVLGPPRNMTRLMKDRPSDAPGRRETYLNARRAEAEVVIRSFPSAAETPEAEALQDLDSPPFSKPYRKLSDAILHDRTWTEPPQPSDPAWVRNVWNIRKKYLEGPEECRIDDDWQNPVSNLALKLDSDTNNTSLVLAFELEPGGEVLLFAADAQVGNWLSWGDQKYPKNAPEDEQIAVADLLKRTVLYKVGHHGSHNATLSRQGLEEIKGANLVALLPLVQAVAEKRRWPMPYDKLLNRLKEMTGGRILRGDEPVSAEVAADIRSCGKEVREEMGEDGMSLGPLWVEYDVS